MNTKLFDLIRTYLDIVDNGTEADQGEKRTLAHEAMMDEMEKCRIPFQSRFEARWIARWIIKGQKRCAVEQPKMMWAKLTPGDLVKTLYNVPPDKENKDGLIPVMVVVMPFEFQPPSAERNNE